MQINGQCCIQQTMEQSNENLKNRIDVRLVSNEKYSLKWASKPSYMSQKIFGNNLMVIYKNKVRLKLHKLAYTRMCVF